MNRVAACSLVCRQLLVSAGLFCLLGALPLHAQVLDEPARDAGHLNVSIAVFDPGVPADPSSHRRLQVFPRIREVEALFLPFVLRETLVATGQWGAVRVVPEPDIAAELQIYGTIVRSDGELLELQVRAIDATGREWINQSFSGRAAPAVAEQPRAGGNTGSLSRARRNSQTAATTTGSGDYQQLYDEIADRLQVAKDSLDKKSLIDITEVSLLRYADQLAPAAFGEYLDATPDGTFSIQRLPAENDPMLERIERIRRVEYVVTDTVDDKFQELHNEIAATYDLWRQYRWQLAQSRHAEAGRQASSRNRSPRGSFEAMKRRYDNYKWARIEEQELEDWAEGFDNEVGGSVEDLETRVAQLETLIEEQYAEWGRILAELFVLETGAVPEG